MNVERISNDPFAELLACEQQKRDAQIDPAQRLRMIEEAIEWADRQRPVSRNSPAVCKAKEARLQRG